MSNPTIAQRVLFYLVSVALIAVMIAIATPNFVPDRSAHSGPRVSRVLADLREMRTAIESYAVDHGVYPPMAWGDSVQPPPPAKAAEGPRRLYATLLVGAGAPARVGGATHGCVTSPIAYISSIFQDPYATREAESAEGGRESARLGELYMYWNLPQYRELLEAGNARWLGSNFPYSPRADQLDAVEAAFGEYVIAGAGPMGWGPVERGDYPLFTQYDPTNGSVSAGTIFVSQKESKPAWVDAAALAP